jgi:hypothetical protein
MSPAKRPTLLPRTATVRRVGVIAGNTTQAAIAV